MIAKSVCVLCSVISCVIFALSLFLALALSVIFVFFSSVKHLKVVQRTANSVTAASCPLISVLHYQPKITKAILKVWIIVPPECVGYLRSIICSVTFCWWHHNETVSFTAKLSLKYPHLEQGRPLWRSPWQYHFLIEHLAIKAGRKAWENFKVEMKWSWW